MSDAPDQLPPLDVRVVAGTPDEYELAAVVAVLQAVTLEAGGADRVTAPASGSPSHWLESRRNLRGPLPTRWG